ncbi:MAG: hypothetical protein PHC61_12440, partial [Chitinivibrionales bacterium]|nr:hypothetical protein [Chitinivibrionales bacterium]
MSSTIWVGNIRFGNANIPVKLHTAVSQNRVQFHLLHKLDRVKLQQRMICAYDKMPVLADEQIKGFPVEGRKYILIDPEELHEVEPESSRTIDVHEFVKRGEIDPVFMERSYYLAADAAPESYNALVEALKEMEAE